MENDSYYDGTGNDATFYGESNPYFPDATNPSTYGGGSSQTQQDNAGMPLNYMDGFSNSSLANGNGLEEIYQDSQNALSGPSSNIDYSDFGDTGIKGNRSVGEDESIPSFDSMLLSQPSVASTDMEGSGVSGAGVGGDISKFQASIAPENIMSQIMGSVGNSMGGGFGQGDNIAMPLTNYQGYEPNVVSNSVPNVAVTPIRNEQTGSGNVLNKIEGGAEKVTKGVGGFLGKLFGGGATGNVNHNNPMTISSGIMPSGGYTTSSMPLTGNKGISPSIESGLGSLLSGVLGGGRRTTGGIAPYSLSNDTIQSGGGNAPSPASYAGGAGGGNIDSWINNLSKNNSVQSQTNNEYMQFVSGGDETTTPVTSTNQAYAQTGNAQGGNVPLSGGANISPEVQAILQQRQKEDSFNMDQSWSAPLQGFGSNEERIAAYNREVSGEPSPSSIISAGTSGAVAQTYGGPAANNYGASNVNTNVNMGQGTSLNSGVNIPTEMQAMLQQQQKEASFNMDQPWSAPTQGFGSNEERIAAYNREVSGEPPSTNINPTIAGGGVQQPVAGGANVNNKNNAMPFNSSYNTNNIAGNIYNHNAKSVSNIAQTILQNQMVNSNYNTISGNSINNTYQQGSGNAELGGNTQNYYNYNTEDNKSNEGIAQSTVQQNPISSPANVSESNLNNAGVSMNVASIGAGVTGAARSKMGAAGSSITPQEITHFKEVHKIVHTQDGAMGKGLEHGKGGEASVKGAEVGKGGEASGLGERNQAAKTDYTGHAGAAYGDAVKSVPVDYAKVNVTTPSVTDSKAPLSKTAAEVDTTKSITAVASPAPNYVAAPAAATGGGGEFSAGGDGGGSEGGSGESGGESAGGGGGESGGSEGGGGESGGESAGGGGGESGGSGGGGGKEDTKMKKMMPVLNDAIAAYTIDTIEKAWWNY